MTARDLFNLKGKVSLVSGGGDGIGRAMAVALADADNAVVIFSRRIEFCEEVAHEIEIQGGRALALGCDILSATDIERVVAETLMGTFTKTLQNLFIATAVSIGSGKAPTRSTV